MRKLLFIPIFLLLTQSAYAACETWYFPGLETSTTRKYIVCDTEAEIPTSGWSEGDIVYAKDTKILKVADSSTTYGSPSQIDLKQGLDADLTDLADGSLTPSKVQSFPVGSVFISVVETNPATLLGYGSWSAIATGRMLVGIDTGDTDFDVVEETGGAKTKTIAQANLPNISTGGGTAHTHVQDAHNHNFLPRSATTGGVSSIVTGTLDTSSTISGSNQPHNQAATATNQNESAHTHSLGGSGTALNVVNPYFVVYIFKRDS